MKNKDMEQFGKDNNSEMYNSEIYPMLIEYMDSVLFNSLASDINLDFPRSTSDSKKTLAIDLSYIDLLREHFSTSINVRDEYIVLPGLHIPPWYKKFVNDGYSLPSEAPTIFWTISKSMPKLNVVLGLTYSIGLWRSMHMGNADVLELEKEGLRNVYDFLDFNRMKGKNVISILQNNGGDDRTKMQLIGFYKNMSKMEGSLFHQEEILTYYARSNSFDLTLEDQIVGDYTLPVEPFKKY